MAAMADSRSARCHGRTWRGLAAEDAAANGGVLDEARVNRLRYLEGTPKSATRWIDTGWALGLWRLGSSATHADKA